MCVCVCIYAAACILALMHQDGNDSPCGDRVLLSLMDARLPDHSDVFNVLPLDAEVGAPNSDGDSSPQGAKTRDDLDEEILGGDLKQI